MVMVVANPDVVNETFVNSPYLNHVRDTDREELSLFADPIDPMYYEGEAAC